MYSRYDVPWEQLKLVLGTQSSLSLSTLYSVASKPSKHPLQPYLERLSRRSGIVCRPPPTADKSRLRCDFLRTFKAASELYSIPEVKEDIVCLEERPSRMMPAPEPTQNEETKDSSLPKGVVLDKDGKPCRTCTSAASWKALAKQAQLAHQSQPQSQSQTQTQSQTTSSLPIPKSIANAASSGLSSSSSTKPECPPDVEELGRSTWTFLHSLAATYPTTASQTQQSEMRTFMNLFSKLYPCWVCAEDFRDWMAEPSGRNQPRVGGRKEFGWWMCDAHNEVNRKLGKPEFDCRFWEERWKDGWKDGRCD